MKKSISVIAACVGAPLLAAGIAVPSASADPTNNPSPPTPTYQPETGPDGNALVTVPTFPLPLPTGPRS